jgi:hypothetical protein
MFTLSRLSLSVCLSVCFGFIFSVTENYVSFSIITYFVMVKKKIRISYDDWKAKLDIFEYRWNNGKIHLFRFLFFSLN